MATSSRIPVLLLTGFLGSGKTTLLNRLMRARPDSRGKLAIVVNEFGAVGIDGDLLPSQMTRQVELPGGCICCVLNEELDTTLIELLENNPDVETIVIETTGIAEPLPISWSLAREPLSERVRLAAVITVVDALEFVRSRSLGPSVDAQVEYADILVLSKTDLLAHEQTNDGATTFESLPSALREALQSLNPTALRVLGSVDDVTRILWQSIADPDMRIRPLAEPPPVTRPVAGTSDEHQHTSSDHRHGGPRNFFHGLESISISIEKTIDFEELSERLETLPAHYVRIKGIAYAVDGSTGSSEPRWVAFHRVGTRVSCEPLDKPSDSRMVALGTGMEETLLTACIAASVLTSDP